VRIFLDTNVLASSIATRGLCSELLENIIREHVLLTCQVVLDELERVPADKFRLPQPVIAGFLGLIKTEARIVASKEPLSISITDAADMPIIASAIAGEAEAFVTGDRELLDLKQVQALSVVSPRQMWLQLAGLEGRKRGS
jgi:putative PIN family toxin of toxin-antitoxin system